MANNNDMLIRMVMAGDASPFLKEVVAAEQKFGSVLQGMSSTAAKIELFGKTQEGAKKASAEFFKLKTETEAYKQALVAATGPYQAFISEMGKAEGVARSSASAQRYHAERLAEVSAAQKEAAKAYAAIKKESLSAKGYAEDYAGALAMAKRELEASNVALEGQQRVFAKAKKEYANSKQAVAAYKAEMTSARKPVDDLEKQVASSAKAQEKAESAMRKQLESLQGLRKELSAAGVDSRNLASAQADMTAKIAAATSRVVQSRRINAARDVLGIRSNLDIEREITQTEAAYERLAKSGTLSMAEQARAAQIARARVSELKAELSTVQAVPPQLLQNRRMNAARDVIGIRSNVEIEREITQIQAAYERLAKSGTLTMSEQARAAQVARARVAELKAELGTVQAVPAKLLQSRRMNAAKEILGLGNDDAGRSLQLAQAAYNRLINSGQLNFGEQVEAARAFQAKVREVRGELAAPAGTGFLSGVRGEIIGTVAALGSLTGAVQATMSVLSKTGAFETLQVQLNNVEKSSVLGAHTFKQLKQLALDTPFGVQGLTQTYTQLKNFGLDPMAGSLQAITDQSAKLGGSQETLTRIALALGQAWSKQKLQGEEVLQFVDAGVPVWDLLGKKLNKTTAELQDMGSKGLLGRDVIRQLIQAMEEESKGAASSQVGTWQGMVSQLQDIWDQFLAEVGNNGPLEAAKSQIKSLMDAIAQAMADGSAADMGRNLAAIISTLGETIRVTVGFVREHADAIKLLIGSYVGMKVLVQVAQWVGALSAALNTLRAIGSTKIAIGMAVDSSGIAKAIGEIALLKTAIGAIPLAAVAGFAALGLAAAAGVKVAIDQFEIWNGQQERALELSREILKQYQSVGDPTKFQTIDTPIVGSATLNGYSREQLALYDDALQRALKTKQLLLQQRAESVERGGGDATQDAEARRLAREAAAYSKALADYKAYTENRVKEEERFGKNVDAVRNGALAGLAEKLAKEQKLYDKANDALKTATEARKKHQEAWYGNKAVDPAKKAKDPATMGVTDYYEGLSKANALGRKAQESQAKAAKTGKDADLRQAARDATATEKAFESLMDTINKLREAGKITEGEFNFFNDQAGRAQDGFDEKTVSKAKDQLQQAMEKVEALKQAAESVKKLQIGFDAAKGIADLDSLLSQFQATAQSKPVKVPVQYVGPDGKYLSDARQALGLPERPPPGVSVGGGTSDPQAEAARARQQQEAQNLAEARRQVGLPSGDAGASKLPIGFDQEAGKADLNKLLTDSQQLAQNQPVQVPVKYVSDGMPPPASLAEARRQVGLPEKGPGFSGGGWTGPGGKYEPAGVVHGGEFVQTQERMREPGALAFMWDFHRRGMGALQDWRGYANGGLVGAALPTFADRISLPDVGGLAQPAAKALGTLMLSLGGQQLAVSADPGEASDFMAGVRRLQLKS
ncbi:tape measure protein [Chromobacterium haemolyticum]|uniref:Tape measure protein n=1 Tax=Chromobacterium fluminis TaxID=3044269 RepID=A0ABX0LHD0_9NEIS|nr:tape measure protein [Chromobacterium haemolyticum]